MEHGRRVFEGLVSLCLKSLHMACNLVHYTCMYNVHTCLVYACLQDGDRSGLPTGATANTRHQLAQGYCFTYLYTNVVERDPHVHTCTYTYIYNIYPYVYQ